MIALGQKLSQRVPRFNRAECAKRGCVDAVQTNAVCADQEGVAVDHPDPVGFRWSVEQDDGQDDDGENENATSNDTW